MGTTRETRVGGTWNVQNPLDFGGMSPPFWKIIWAMIKILGMRRVFRGLYYQNQKNTPTRLRLFDYLDHHSNAHMGWHIITNDINKTIFQATKYWLLPPQTEPFSKKNTDLSVVPTSSHRVVRPQEESLPTFQAVEAKRKELARAPLPKDAAMLQRSFFQQLLGLAPDFWASRHPV